MKFLIDLAEKGLIPDRFIRLGIRSLDRKRLAEEARKEVEAGETGVCRFIQNLRESPIALEVEKPKEQHYEVPPAFFSKGPGKTHEVQFLLLVPCREEPGRGRGGHAGAHLRKGADGRRHGSA